MGGPVNGELSHLSIGEVLGLLQGEFPDVTISKIRFLEAQGLLDPERSPSGYRKFREDDIERIRWILLQQRDHFLPLKVIKERLASGDLSTDVPEGVLPLGRRAETDQASESGGRVVEMQAGGSRPNLVAQLVEAPAELERRNFELIAEEDERGRHPRTSLGPIFRRQPLARGPGPRKRTHSS